MENKITPEHIEKAKACKSVEELIALAKENGIEMTEAEATNLFAKLNPANGELSDSELDTVAGGCGGSDSSDSKRCPYCRGTNIGITINDKKGVVNLCYDCKKTFCFIM